VEKLFGMRMAGLFQFYWRTCYYYFLFFLIIIIISIILFFIF